jgi:hypothetical protein
LKAEAGLPAIRDALFDEVDDMNFIAPDTRRQFTAEPYCNAFKSRMQSAQRDADLEVIDLTAEELNDIRKLIGTISTGAHANLNSDGLGESLERGHLSTLAEKTRDLFELVRRLRPLVQ